jgi:hypothetical protein
MRSLVDWLAQHDAPAAVAFFEEIVEAAGADHVAHDALDRSALGDLHLGLCNGAIALEVDARPTLEMRGARAAGKALLAHLDEVLEAALEPGRHHDALGMPAGAEIVPAPGVAPHRPVVDDVADGETVEEGGRIGHCRRFLKRHARACRGHPRLISHRQDVDGRD